MRFAIVTGLAVVLLGAAALAGVGRPDEARSQSEAERENVVTVAGVGRIDTVPDRAQLSIGVTSRADTAKEASTQNAGRMREVIAALRGAGIEAADIQTQELALEPRFSRSGGLVGYTARNTVAAESTLEELAAALDAAVAAGATRTHGFSLTRADQDALYRRALARAVDDARAKAKALAAAGNFELGGVVGVEEGTDGQYPYRQLAFADASAAGAPIAPGTQKVTATASVSFEIR